MLFGILVYLSRPASPFFKSTFPLPMRPIRLDVAFIQAASTAVLFYIKNMYKLMRYGIRDTLVLSANFTRVSIETQQQEDHAVQSAFGWMLPAGWCITDRSTSSRIVALPRTNDTDSLHQLSMISVSNQINNRVFLLPATFIPLFNYDSFGTRIFGIRFGLFLENLRVHHKWMYNYMAISPNIFYVCVISVIASYCFLDSDSYAVNTSSSFWYSIRILAWAFLPASFIYNIFHLFRMNACIAIHLLGVFETWFTLSQICLCVFSCVFIFQNDPLICWYAVIVSMGLITITFIDATCNITFATRATRFRVVLSTGIFFFGFVAALIYFVPSASPIANVFLFLPLQPLFDLMEVGPKPVNVSVWLSQSCASISLLFLKNLIKLFLRPHLSITLAENYMRFDRNDATRLVEYLRTHLPSNYSVRQIHV